MEVIKEYSGFWGLYDNSWSGAIQTLDKIKELGLEDELMDFLEEYFSGGVPTETEVNDLLWFEEEYILNELGVDEEEDEDEEDDEDE